VPKVAACPPKGRVEKAKEDMQHKLKHDNAEGPAEEKVEVGHPPKEAKVANPTASIENVKGKKKRVLLQKSQRSWTSKES
jgi:hypothetical protein